MTLVDGVVAFFRSTFCPPSASHREILNEAHDAAHKMAAAADVATRASVRMERVVDQFQVAVRGMRGESPSRKPKRKS